ncbi:hypothetical protein GGU11DRAFT_753417 [Lentinula aff. detonsa]|nr:hypothetical protein GGU11DRAFT_753417 [Lentinula aff. detonsa]
MDLMSRNTGEEPPQQEELEPPQPPKMALLRSEQTGSLVSGAPRNLDINGDAAHNARAANDINNTVNYLNAHPVSTDFNNNYSGATRYNGPHNDYKGSTNYNGAHNDIRRSSADNLNREQGAAQLRQCVEKFLAKWFSGKDLMSDLADTLINAGWDRKTLTESEWGDIKDVYKGSGWTSPTFVRLRKICRDWDM